MLEKQKGVVFSPKIYGKVTKFSLSISRKNKSTGKWESASLFCTVLNEKLTNGLADKMKVVVSGDLIPIQWTDKTGNVVHNMGLWVTDLVVESGAVEDMASTEEELPFT